MRLKDKYTAYLVIIYVYVYVCASAFLFLNVIVLMPRGIVFQEDIPTYQAHRSTSLSNRS